MNDKYDPLFKDVLEFAIEEGKVSAMLVSRRFNIGYNRASRILEQLEELGVLGPVKSQFSREVLICKNMKKEKPVENSKQISTKKENNKEHKILKKIISIMLSLLKTIKNIFISILLLLLKTIKNIFISILLLLLKIIEFFSPLIVLLILCFLGYPLAGFVVGFILFLLLLEASTNKYENKQMEKFADILASKMKK